MTKELLERARDALRRSGIPAELPDDVVEVLALVADEPEGAAERMIAALRVGSRAALESSGVIEPVQRSGPHAGRILITARGREVIAACGAEVRHDPQREQRAADELARAHESWLRGGETE